ncbi:hypothetical protein [Halorhabdus amylolytica]|uniref:hypothetical protein n=1 Tax=Halorhabdus amylolytica TaxID=2559573 RepID=UPI0010AA1831|nr:hypothetical protein [Halorhabdus amylolytica]
MTSPVELVGRSLSEEAGQVFDDRVEEQAEYLRERVATEDLETEDFAIGLEMEVYAVSTEGSVPSLREIPDAVYGASDRVSKELGLHNAEVNTEPVALRPGGFESQRIGIETALEAAGDALGTDAGVALDAMWTVPPEGGSEPYLSAHRIHDGVTLATNMRADPRYYAIDNEVLGLVDGAVPMNVTGTSRTFPTILFESLATSIQPHVQIPSVGDFPAYYNAAIRTLGPLLALSSNSPFLPPDLNDDVSDPGKLVAETPHELRIPVFEQSVNHSEYPKVRVPDDIEATADVIDQVVADDRYAPFLSEWLDDEGESEEFRDAFPEFEHKRGTYWRWVRAVIGGDPVAGAGDERSIRIEYRPLPTQPTVRDVVALQALTAGLLRGLVASGHPITELSAEAARESFYAAVEDGPGADLAWVRVDGTQTSDPSTIFGEVFEYARCGLRKQGFADGRIDELLGPIEARRESQTTPSRWKKDRVREHLDDGDDLATAIKSMQREYMAQSRGTETFAEWL